MCLCIFRFSGVCDITRELAALCASIHFASSKMHHIFELCVVLGRVCVFGCSI